MVMGHLFLVLGIFLLVPEPCSEGEGAEATPSLLRAETHSSLVGGRCVPTSFRIHKFLTATIMGARPLLLYSLMLVSMQL